MSPQSRPRFDSTINLGHLITLGVVIAAAIGNHWLSDYRLAALERQMARLSEVVIAQAVTAERLNGLALRIERLERQ